MASEATPARIRIRDLRLSLIIGTYESERVHPQEVVIDLSLWGPWLLAARTDSLQDTLDYKDFTDRLREHLKSSRFQLLERLAREILEFCLLSDPRITRVELELFKPEALAPSLVSLCAAADRNQPSLVDGGPVSGDFS